MYKYQQTQIFNAMELLWILFTDNRVQMMTFCLVFYYCCVVCAWAHYFLRLETAAEAYECTSPKCKESWFMFATMTAKITFH